MLELYPDSHLVPWATLVVAHVMVLLGLGFLVICLVGLARHLLLARRLRAGIAQGAASRPTAPRADTMLYGTVEAIADATPLTVEISQRQGPDSQDDVAWLEEARELRTAPFHLLTATGDRLRVEPDDRSTKLAGLPLDETIELGPYTRLRRGGLRAGTPVYVRGTLVRGNDPSAGFRGGAALVLRPGPQLIISSQPLDGLARTRAWRFATGVAALCVFLVASFPLVVALRLLYCGVTVKAEITQLRTVLRKNSDGERVEGQLAQLRVRAGEVQAGHVFEQGIWSSDRPRLKVGTVVVARLVPGSPGTAQLGRQPSLNMVYLVPLFMALVFAGTVFAYAVRRVAWWDGPLREPVEEGG